MDGFGKTTRIVISLVVVVFGVMYLAADYLGADATAELREWRKLLMMMFAMLLSAVVLLGIFKLVGKLMNYLIDRQSRDDDSSSNE